jgi:hypothetical protein
MRLGGQVPALLSDWRFIAQDTHDISRRVRELDPDARLAMEMDGGCLGIVRRVVLPVDPDVLQADPHDTWIIGFRAADEDGNPLTGEPDARILEQMRLRDSWRLQNPERFRRAAERAVAMREHQLQQLTRERAREFAETYLWAGRRYAGIKHNIYVPADLPREG